MSQAQPGKVLSRQVPPSRSAFSRMTKFSQPAWRSLIAMHRPANPDPTIATSYPAFSSAAIAAKVTGQSGPVSVLFRIGFQPMQDLPGVRDDEGVRIVLVLRQVEPRR